jgi:NADH-quinone oxidoreductase subunit F
VDLHLIPEAITTEDERAAIDIALGTTSDHLDVDGRRHLLLPALHAAHTRVGWISEGALNYICARLDVPPAEAYGVASFYALFSLTPRPPTVVHVCNDIACLANGAETLGDEMERHLGHPGQPALSGQATWQRSPCIGQCERAPAAFYQLAGKDRRDWTLPFATADAVIGGLHEHGLPDSRLNRRASRHSTPSAPQTGAARATGLRLLRRVGLVDPESLDDYRAHGGYASLRHALALGVERVIREVSDSRLLGRGGAAFPAGRKWDAVARSPVRPHYLVCNADESEPGTFKDRVLMEEDPFALIEAMTICGYATGCEQGFIYIRGEFPLATQRLRAAIEQTRDRGFLGSNIFGSGIRFDVDLRRGAGAYICGEETALFNSLEGRRGEPRNKPPFPVEAGLFGKPTVVNNVETLVNVLDIVSEGGPAFSNIGTSGSSGTKLFCVSGCARTPGVYEVPFGITLRELIDLAGGVRGDRPLQAVLLGGAAGVFMSPQELDVPLTFEGTRAAGTTLGSGVVMLFDETVDLRKIVLRIAAFFRDESCGQCVPCRVGTVRQEEALMRLAAGRPLGSEADEGALIEDVAQVMRDASICGLGQTASSAVQSAIRKFRLFDGGSRA